MQTQGISALFTIDLIEIQNHSNVNRNFSEFPPQNQSLSAAIITKKTPEDPGAHSL